MNMRRSGHIEASAPAGFLFILLGVSVWLLQYVAGIFTGWAWAALVGNVWVLFGMLLLFSDIRIYQFDRSPVEQLLTEAEEK